jgi:hypothetical protein
MDDGIGAIILIISTLLLSLFIYIYFADKALFMVFFILSIILIFLLIYTCLCVLAARWDKHRIKKDWDFLEEMDKIRKNEF